jgi:hypothetical protein
VPWRRKPWIPGSLLLDPMQVWFLQKLLQGLSSQELLWRTPKSLVEPTWGSNYVKLRKVGTWEPLPTSSTRTG